MHIALDPGETLEIEVDHRLRFVRCGSKPSGEAPTADAIEDREVDRFGPAAGVAVDLAEHFLRGARVDVFACREGLFQLGHVGHVRGETQFDLAVVGGEDHVALIGHKGMADLAADLGADRDVLQVGLGRGEPPGLRADQAVACVDPPRGGIDRLLQCFGIGTAQLRQLPPFKHFAGDWSAFAVEPFEYRLVGRILPGLALLAALVAELVEQDVAELFGAADGEGLPGQFVDFALQLADFGGESGGEPCKRLAVNLDPVAFHLGHYWHQGPIDAFINSGAAFIRQARFEQAVEPPGDFGVFGGIFGRAV